MAALKEYSDILSDVQHTKTINWFSKTDRCDLAMKVFQLSPDELREFFFKKCRSSGPLRGSSSDFQRALYYIKDLGKLLQLKLTADDIDKAFSLIMTGVVYKNYTLD